jgi:hypothetical protein
VVLPTAVVLLARDEWPRWTLMWALAASIYAGCKWLTWRRTPVRGVPRWKHAAYLLAWPGLNAQGFLTERSDRPLQSEWTRGAIGLFVGLALFFTGTWITKASHPYVVGWIGMTGVVLTLHFGAFQVLSCAWRQIGVDARPLMNRPLASVSLTEFWGRRWNTAFRDLTHRFLFRPLTGRIGTRGAIVCGFVFSGLVHDVVISMPARGGYGGPTSFFAIQAVAMLFERSPAGQRWELGRGWTGRLYTFAALALPAYWLFHPPFVETIIVPFMRALGAA